MPTTICTLSCTRIHRLQSDLLKCILIMYCVALYYIYIFVGGKKIIIALTAKNKALNEENNKLKKELEVQFIRC